MSQTKLSLVSLGMSCQTAVQLEHFASTNPGQVQFAKSPFDWLICPPKSAASWLNADLADFNRNEIRLKNEQVWWERHQLWFWHGFQERIGENRMINIETTFQREREKLNYQRSRFRAIDPEKTLFFASNTQNNLATTVFKTGEETHFHLDANAIQKLQASLNKYFGQPTELHWFTRPDRCTTEITDNPNVHLLNLESSEWKGDPNNWRAILNKIVNI